ncbi:hypothetical protein FOMPIDRAFT_88440 [Fomitopsis schrenkii]|uniref:Uncharacterized protein n=1 Tax=Fomitopsis schrenkii TaxID=2126942 RepID=S8EB31_FOMSC|nr:hypothetical protein FOMPIDRAFT_88440 [Fomitopsis schrenkii]
MPPTRESAGTAAVPRGPTYNAIGGGATGSGGPRMRDTEKDERRYRQSANTSFKSHDDS